MLPTLSFLRAALLSPAPATTVTETALVAAVNLLVETMVALTLTSLVSLAYGAPSSAVVQPSCAVLPACVSPLVLGAVGSTLSEMLELPIGNVCSQPRGLAFGVKSSSSSVPELSAAVASDRYGYPRTFVGCGRATGLSMVRTPTSSDWIPPSFAPTTSASTGGFDGMTRPRPGLPSQGQSAAGTTLLLTILAVAGTIRITSVADVVVIIDDVTLSVTLTPTPTIVRADLTTTALDGGPLDAPPRRPSPRLPPPPSSFPQALPQRRYDEVDGKGG